MDKTPVFRFAPSPNGLLHLGHAFSSLVCFDLAEAYGGRFLLRMEDIDTARCSRAHEEQICQDLKWLGLEWETPIRRQSDHFEDYRAAINTLLDAGLVYRSTLSRGDIRAMARRAEEEGGHWPRDPDGAMLHPGRSHEPRVEQDEPHALRLDLSAALDHIGGELEWIEEGAGPNGETGAVAADPSVWGDVVLARKDTPTSYNVSVVVDDALQGITHVVRGRDLFHATGVHVLLQRLFGYEQPVYYHHELVLGDDGRKLSKSQGDTSIYALRQAGLTPQDVRRLIGYSGVETAVRPAGPDFPLA